MNRSWRTFVLVALVGLSVLVLAQAPAQAQFRRLPGARIPPYRVVAPRAFVATPPAIVPYAGSYTYLPSGLNLNQAAALNALRIQTQLYNPLYNPYYLSGYPTGNVPYYGSGVPYNPYFSGYGLYP